MNSPCQIPLFDSPRRTKERRINNRELIRTDSFSNARILSWISELYLPDGIDLDCTWNKGLIYRGTNLRPKLRFDIAPKRGLGVMAAADFCALPLRDGSIGSAVFDPPFFAASSKSSKIYCKYGGYNRPEGLWDSYRAGLMELYRVLKLGGVLVMKCQDSVFGRKQYLLHADVILYAKSIRLYARDMFIKIQHHVSIGANQHNQNHARKTHCYYLVFEKKRRIIPTI
jgi:hypothetical protein